MKKEKINIKTIVNSRIFIIQNLDENSIRIYINSVKKCIKLQD